MDDSPQMVPIDSLHFSKKTDVLAADLIDRITLIHHAFRDYLDVTLEETINNFKYDTHPENEIRIWEHMASVVLTLKYQHNWTHGKVASAVKLVLGLSVGAIQNNDLDEASTQQIISLWSKRDPQ